MGRFLSVDPLTGSYPMLTPYQFASNTPIQAIDLDGLEAELAQKIKQVVKAVQTTYETVKLAFETAALIHHEVSKFEKGLDNTIETSNDIKSISGALFVEFLTGLGPETREFNQKHPFTESLIHSRTTRIALEKWKKGYQDYKVGKRSNLPEYYAVSWPDINSSFPGLHINESGPIRELAEDGEFTTSQFTGNAIYNFDFDQETETLSVLVYDDKNVRSLMLHMTNDEHSRSDLRILGKTIQTYHFKLNIKEIKDLIDEPKPRCEECGKKH